MRDMTQQSEDYKEDEWDFVLPLVVECDTNNSLVVRDALENKMFERVSDKDMMEDWEIELVKHFVKIINKHGRYFKE